MYIDDAFELAQDLVKDLVWIMSKEIGKIKFLAFKIAGSLICYDGVREGLTENL